MKMAKKILILICVLLFIEQSFGASVSLDDAKSVISAPLDSVKQQGLNEAPVGNGVFRPPKRLPKKMSLKDNPACFGEISSLCGNAPTNFDVLECVQNKERSVSNFLNQECHHLMWQFKLNVTKGGHVEDIAREACKAETQLTEQCKQEGHNEDSLTCMTQYLDQIQDEKCHHYLVKLASIIFSDFRLVSHMTEMCSEDINKLQCGRLQPLSEPSPHSQGAVIECLSRSSQKLSDGCHKEILRLAELQADDFHLDRPVFFACREDREKFCPNVRAGRGKVYKCLMKHKMERTMTKECADKLTTRQKLVQEDYKVSKGLTKSCRSYIQALKCQKNGKVNEGNAIKLSVVLLCLEDGLRRGSPIDSTCQEEMINHRRMLLENYQLSPDLVVGCKGEIKRMCGGGKELGGRTLHCLMKNARHSHVDGSGRVSEHCKRQIEMSIKVTDAGEDWRVDPVLHEACSSVVQSSCSSVLGGQAKVMRCLMRQLGTTQMSGSCEAALLEIQYFVARDWKLDPQLYSACYNDSVNKCHAKKTWATSSTDTDPERGILVLPCLFRMSYHPSPENRISEMCSEEVRRVMHERSAYVDLHPEIEAACMMPLAEMCSDRTKPGEELFCLQQRLDRVPPECRAVVSNYTEAEVKDYQLNNLVAVHCATIIPEVCLEESRQLPVEGAVMQCLVANKNLPIMRENAKCRAVVENFQIVTLRNINFTPKFKKECHGDVIRFCSRSKSKKEVVDCLSNRVRDDLLADDRPQVSRGCRSQLRNQLLQRHSSIKLDSELNDACSGDISQYCWPEKSTDGTMECLRSYKERLSSQCHQVLFKRQQEEQLDPGTDSVLLSSCHQMIKVHCSTTNHKDLLKCLKRQRDDPTFNKKCRRVVISRMIEHNTDARFNADLLTGCKDDIAKHCGEVFRDSNEHKTEVNGKLLDCLQVIMSKHKLSERCSAQVISQTKEASMYYKMDAQLNTLCRDEVPLLCHEEQQLEVADGGNRGAVLECLKLALEADNIKSLPCREHVAQLIEVQQADIHADPQLYEACGIDDKKFCAGQITGNHLSCLYDVLNRNHAALNRQCREMLRLRREMFKKAVQVFNINGIEDVVNAVYTSHVRTYLLILLFGCLFVVFVGGLCCGRSTRKYKLLKNR